MIDPDERDYLAGDSVDWQRLFRDMVRTVEPLIHLATAIEYGQDVDKLTIGAAATSAYWFVDAELRMRTQSAVTGRSLFGDFPGIEVQK